MEPPECPVCLEPYDAESTVPRVLSCGHSACQDCLSRLPRQYPNTIRCPACTHLAPLSNPSSLPKNIDLLRLLHQYPSSSSSSSSYPKTPKPPAQLKASHQFLPCPWTPDFFSTWKRHVLQSHALVMLDATPPMVVDHSCLYYGKLSSPDSSNYRPNQEVSLLPVANSPSNESEFTFSYTARVVEALYHMEETKRDELSLLIRAASRQRRLSKVYGLWMNSLDGSLFLVSEKFGSDLSSKLSKLKIEGETSIICFSTVGMELCEALMDFHLEGLVSGFLAPSCFSLDNYGHFFVDLNELLVTGRRIRKISVTGDTAEADFLKIQAFMSPEVFLSLRERSTTLSKDTQIGFGSDIWSLGCILIRNFLGDEFTKEILEGSYSHLSKRTKESGVSLGLYSNWMDKMESGLTSILGSEFKQLNQFILCCLDYNPGKRPRLSDLWRCMRGFLYKPEFDVLLGLDVIVMPDKIICCAILGYLCGAVLMEVENVLKTQKRDEIANNLPATDLVEKSVKVEKNLIEGLCEGKFKSVRMEGHRDCITGLAVGGGFLFSSSLDKTVHVWSLQDFSLVKSFKGHEHRVMAVLAVGTDNPLCISGDSGGLIFVWSINTSHGSEPMKKWNEHSDWRYSGVLSLAASGVDFLYSGSGDRSIKAWSLKDYTLTATMTGHKSAVSALAVCSGVLYSGSWDGTIRLWWLSDHTPLSVLGENPPGNISSVLSLAVNPNILVASHENGSVKMWKNGVLVKSVQIHESAILSLAMFDTCLFMGGWNKTIDLQEFLEDEFEVDTRVLGTISCDAIVTSLLYWQGKLIVGCSDKVIKVYYCELS